MDRNLSPIREAAKRGHSQPPPARGAWIATAWNVDDERQVARLSPPARGAWIATVSPEALGERLARESPPARGAWIATVPSR